MNEITKKAKPFYKKWWFIVIAVFVGLIILGGILPKQNDKEQSEEISSVDENATEILELIKTLQNNIDSYKGVSDDKIWAYDTPIELIQRLENEQRDFNKHELFLGKDEKIDSLISEEKIWLKKALANNYKQSRIQYYKNIKETMWENNITVNLAGENNNYLEFIGRIFANNKNKKDTQLKIQSIVERMRFKIITYKWIKHDDEPKTYIIDSPEDTEII